MSMYNDKINISNRSITKDELNMIYDDFLVIERKDGLPDANTRRLEYTADSDDGIIGYASGLTYYEWFYLTDLWVHEDYRRKKIGTELLSLLENEVKSIGIKHIYTWTSGFKNPKFYGKQGYYVFTVFEDFYKVKGYHKIGYRKDL